MGFKIFLKEEKSKFPFEISELENICKLTFKLTGKREGHISLVVCNDSFIEELNERYRKKKGPTDVLSFSMRGGEFSDIGNNLLGDIVISLETAKRQAFELGETPKEEFFTLFIHGLLHLLGFTHDSLEKERVMVDYTKRILLGVN